MERMRHEGNKWFLGHITIVTIFILMSSLQSYGCLDQERAALLLLNASTYSSSWKDEKTSDCCDWDGVTCGKSKRVISLSLASMMTSSSSHLNASHFLTFQELQVLDLSSNSITSWIEVEGMKLSSKLHKLKVLELQDNKLNNSIFQHLSGFQSLKRLKLNDNQLEGNISIHDIETISSNLQELDLSNNKVTGILDNNGCEPKRELQQSQVPGNTWCFSSLQSLRKLDLSENQLTGELPSWFTNLSNLETLDLSANHLTGNIGSSPLIHLLSLTDLTVSENRFQIPDSFQSFANHSKLKYFIADSNQVVHELSALNSESFRFRLEAFSLSGCALSAYPSFLHDQRQLILVDLSNNFLDGDFPTWFLENNPRLDTLVLTNNSLSGSFKLPSSVHAYLSQLFISQNKIQGQIPVDIGAVFPKLQELDLSSNELVGNIPSSLSYLSSLKGLRLFNNHLSGGISNVPDSFVNITYLDLSSNDFTGRLPPFFDLVSLYFLNLQGNKFSGSLRTTKMSSPTLEVLILSNNMLDGPVPVSLFSGSMFPNLLVLDLSYNRFNGPLPKTQSLTVMILSLNNNRLSGYMTNSFCYNTSGVAHLDLSDNGLTGTIPTAIGNFTNLSTLSLRGNQFHGKLPLQLCKLLGLSVLDLSFNSFDGHIPSCLSEITFSAGIDLDVDFASDNFNNRMKGRLGELIWEKGDSSFGYGYSGKEEFTTKSQTYDYRGSITMYMTGMDLSQNKLSGQIPLEIGNLSNLHALNLSHNELWGAIPATLSKLKNIESLDFSYNQLNGRIPIVLTSLHTLEVFKVAYNNLSGKIPFEAQFSTFEASSYQGNPFLCGPPLTKNCTDNEFPSIDKNATNDEDGEWIDMGSFYITFTASGVTMFLVVVIINLMRKS